MQIHTSIEIISEISFSYAGCVNERKDLLLKYFCSCASSCISGSFGSRSFGSLISSGTYFVIFSSQVAPQNVDFIEAASCTAFSFACFCMSYSSTNLNLSSYSALQCSYSFPHVFHLRLYAPCNLWNHIGCMPASTMSSALLSLLLYTSSKNEALITHPRLYHLSHNSLCFHGLPFSSYSEARVSLLQIPNHFKHGSFKKLVTSS